MPYPLNLVDAYRSLNGCNASNGQHYFERARPTIGLPCQNFDHNLNRGILLVYLRNQGIKYALHLGALLPFIVMVGFLHGRCAADSVRVWRQERRTIKYTRASRNCYMGNSGHWLLLSRFSHSPFWHVCFPAFFPRLNFDFFPEAFQNIYHPISINFSVRFPSFPASAAVVRMM